MNSFKCPEGFNEWLTINAKDYNAKELSIMIKKIFNFDYSPDNLRCYLYRHGIEYKREYPKMAFSKSKFPIGSESVKKNGDVQIKVAHNKWVLKQRYVYEQYHNVTLKDDEYIIFLDQDKTNFNIDNLKMLSAKEHGYMSASDLYSKNKEATETGILATKLHFKTEETSSLEIRKKIKKEKNRLQNAKRKEYFKKYHEENKEKIRKQKKEYYERRKKEKVNK